MLVLFYMWFTTKATVLMQELLSIVRAGFEGARPGASCDVNMFLALKVCRQWRETRFEIY